jgi:hypothetical protein
MNMEKAEKRELLTLKPEIWGMSIDLKVLAQVMRWCLSGATRWRIIVASISARGLPRRIAILCMSAIAGATSILLAARLHTNDLGVALVILGISLLSFSFIAWLSFDCLRGWRLVDFPWICASFTAIVVALTNISEGERRDKLFQAKLQMNQAFSSLIYAAQSTVTNDCQELPTRASTWQRSAEPYSGACDRMKHFIPQMEYSYNEFTTLADVTNINAWGADIRVPETTPAGSWAGLYDSADRFTKAVALYESARERNKPSLTGLQRLLIGTELKYWYFFMAFFVGLRISKTTAEMLQTRASARAPQR